MNAKKEIGYENVHKQQGWPQAWEYYQAKPIQTLEQGRAETFGGAGAQNIKGAHETRL